MQRKRSISYQGAGLCAGVIAAGLAASFSSSRPAFSDDAAAHAIADKFSGAPEARRKEESRREAERQRLKTEAEARERAERERRAAEQARAEELEMLAKARRESEEREAIERLQQAEVAARERQRAEEAARLAAEAESRKVATERTAREAEERRLAQERRDRERLAAEVEERRIEEIRKADAERAAREAEERRLAEEQRLRLEAEREAEARRIVEKHNRAREAREESATAERPESGPEIFNGSEQARPSSDTAGARRQSDTRATVLLVLEPGMRGIRKGAPTADPVLCSGLVCYVSMGPGNLSHAFVRSAVLGPINTLGRRAWACRHKLGCVFRSVDMSSGRVMFQPVDLRIMRHDRRESLTAEIDTTCDVDAGRLTCAKPIRAASWRAWIVPESVAREAGPGMLEAAVKAGLPDTRSAQWR